MFGSKTNDIRDLESRLRNLQSNAKYETHVRRGLRKTIQSLTALNEKLYNAIDKKNEKIRALQYQIANPGSEPVETISVPARGLDKHEIFIGE